MPARIMTANCAVKFWTSLRPGPKENDNGTCFLCPSSAGAKAMMYSPRLRIICEAAARLFAAITPAETCPDAFFDS